MAQNEQFGPKPGLTIDQKETLPYLGDLSVAQALFSKFSRQILTAYDDFLHAKRGGDEVQADIERIVKEYGGIFMGRVKRYVAAPGRTLQGSADG
jgi:hypothetical protein